MEPEPELLLDPCMHTTAHLLIVIHFTSSRRSQTAGGGARSRATPAGNQSARAGGEAKAEAEPELLLRGARARASPGPMYAHNSTLANCHSLHFIPPERAAEPDRSGRRSQIQSYSCGQPERQSGRGSQSGGRARASLLDHVCTQQHTC